MTKNSRHPQALSDRRQFFFDLALIGRDLFLLRRDFFG